MDWIALLKTITLCLISIIIELLSYSKEGKVWFENLQQPKYSFPFKFWYLMGGIYYIICGIIAYRLFTSTTEIFTLPVILLTLIMVINGLTNFILFTFHSLRFFNLIFYPFLILFLALMVTLFQTDKISFALAGIYLLWMGYDVYYFKELRRLNTKIYKA